jgi:sigma-B regulation protein RsbU (phosphoserine phosphatase)
VELEPGDTLFLFTDGITEAMNNEMEEYSDERLEELVSKMGIGNAKTALEQVIDDVTEFTEGAEQSDDITCLVIKYK